MGMMAKTKLVLIFLSAAVVGYGLLGGLLEKVAAGEDDVYSQLSIFTDVLERIRKDYVEEPDMTKAMSGALQGMVEALDPFSSFVPGTIHSELSAQQGAGGHTGLVLAKRYGYLFVVAVDPGSSAEAEGLRTGDLLESIEGSVTTRMSPWEANARMEGEPGSSIRLRVVRARRSQPSEIALTRQPLQFQSVASRLIEPRIGLLRIPHFNEGVAEDVRSRLKMLLASEVEGILIDIRDNARGDFQEAVRAVDYFLPQGVSISSARNREGSSVEFPSLQPAMTELPLVLLQDGGTSGAAEIFAAALQDHKRAEVVGERTNGRGSLQKPFPLNDGAMLFVSTTLFVRPNGDPIQATSQRKSGIEPDVRAPSPEFLTNFYFENTTENLEDEELDEFYRKLDQAIERQRLDRGLETIRDKVLKKKAA